MNNCNRGRIGVFLAVLLLITATGCGSKRQPPSGGLSGTIALSGSTAMLPLATATKEPFEELHPGVTINVSGGGAFNGLAQVASGAVNIGNSDVPAPPQYDQDGLVDHRVAVSPFLIVTHRDVTVTDLTLAQVAAVLRGEITNWNQVGGRDQRITVVSRQQSSGSRATIAEKVLDGKDEITPDALIMDSNGKVAASVISTPGAVGYVDAPYYKPDQMGSVRIDGVAYSPQAVLDGDWPIFAFAHMFTKGEATGLTKAFIDFVLSPEFQKEYVEQLGFIPIASAKVK